MNHTGSGSASRENTELQHNELNLCCEVQLHVKQLPLISTWYTFGARVSNRAVN